MVIGEDPIYMERIWNKLYSGWCHPAAAGWHHPEYSFVPNPFHVNWSEASPITIFFQRRSINSFEFPQGAEPINPSSVIT